jgi:GntR family histidine utilization transcriptional repressor
MNDVINDLIPNYVKIKKFILGNIQNGKWEPGHKIPSENELSALFSISRMTVNKALRELTSEGILIRVQGKGTYVAEENSVSEMLEIKGVVDTIEKSGKKHHLEVILKEEVFVNKEISKWMSIFGKESVYHVILLHFADNEPYQIEDRYVNKKMVPDFLNIDFKKETAHQYLMRTTPLTEAEHIVEAVLPDEFQANLLQIDKNMPCLRLKRRTWLNSKVVTYVKFISSGMKYKIGTRFKYNKDGIAVRESI